MIATYRPMGPRRITHWHLLSFLFAIGLSLAVFLPGLTRAQAARHVPSSAAIRRIMARTVEMRDHATHFVPVGHALTIADGRGGGTLTAVIGVRHPTADGHGQLVFFWYNTHFVGWDTVYEKAAIMRVKSPAAGTFNITYARYAAKDPLCCPSLKPVTITYGWSGQMFISDGAPPRADAGMKVILLK